MPRDKQSIRNTPMAKAYISAGGKVDNEGIPYGDRSGKDDTATYLEPTPSGKGSSFIDEWRNKIFADSSWLPTKPGQVVIVPGELIRTPGNTAGFQLPPGYQIGPNKTPAFTPPNQPKVPSVGIIVIPGGPADPNKKKTSPRPIPDRIDKPKRTGILPGEQLPGSL